MAHRRPPRITLVRSLMLSMGVLALLVGSTQAQGDRRVVVLPTTGVVDQVMAGYLREGITAAAAGGAAAVVIELDTPGGSLEATRDIVQAQLSAEIPVFVWVGPAGSRAASAGTFLTLAAHVAAMAPATNIGAATPISGDGSDIPDDLGEKVLADTIATITAIAEERGRPVDWAVSTVEEAASYTVDQALAAGAIDFKASSIEDLLVAADGRTVQVAGQPVVLDTSGARIERVDMNPLQGFLHLLSDPNIAFILFTLGFYGLFFELQNPNWVTGILGAFAIILAFIGFGSLPLNIAGVLLVGLALLLFLLEIDDHQPWPARRRRPGGLRAGRLCLLHAAWGSAGTDGGRGLAHHRRHDRADGPDHRGPGRPGPAEPPCPTAGHGRQPHHAAARAARNLGHGAARPAAGGQRLRRWRGVDSSSQRR